MRAVRIRRRGPGGAGLFGALLGLAVFGALVTAGYGWLEDRQRERLARTAAEQTAVVAAAARRAVQADFAATLAALGGGRHEIALADLRTANTLPAGFPDVGALGRSWRVLLLPAGPNAFDVLVAETVPAGDTVWPAAAVRGAEARIGIVQPDAPRLRGPRVDADVGPFRTAFGGQPLAGALGIVERHDARTVCGDYLYRRAVPGCPGATVMETDLDLGGNALLGADRIEADRLEVAETFEAGSLRVDSALVVGQALVVNGTAAVAGTATAGALDVAGQISAARAAVRGAVSATDVDARGRVAADSMGLSGALAARTVTATSRISAATLNAPTVNARRRLLSDTVRITRGLQAASVTAAGDVTVRGTLRAGQVFASGRLTAPTAVVDRLTVGSCSGC